MQVFYTKFSDYEALPECPLSKYRKNKISNIKNPEIFKKQIITEFFLLKCLISLDPDLRRPLDISVSDNGKPYIEGFKYRFSISHSDDLLMIAIDENEIGIDCQKTVEKEKYLKICNRYFSNEEKNYITDEDSFTEIWTKKEAYAKMHGISVFDVLSENIMKYKIEHTKFENYHVSISVLKMD